MLKWYYTNSSKEMTEPYACFQEIYDDERYLIVYCFLIVKQRLTTSFFARTIKQTIFIREKATV